MDKCLCYSKEKGLYTKYCYEDDNDNCILIRAWETKGYKSKTVKIEEENLTISINSNFGYGRNSYLTATINKDGKRLLDYEVEKLQVLNKVSVTSLCVKENDWYSLFNKIINITTVPLKLGNRSLKLLKYSLL